MKAFKNFVRFTKDNGHSYELLASEYSTHERILDSVMHLLRKGWTTREDICKFYEHAMDELHAKKVD